MRAHFLILAQLTGAIIATSNYSVEIPATAIVVTTWDMFHKEAAKFPDEMAVFKYGGYVIEVDRVIKLATDDTMTQQITAKLNSLPPVSEGDEVGEPPILQEERGLNKRYFSHPPCFNSALCQMYTDCHVCAGQNPGAPTRTGRCIETLYDVQAPHQAGAKGREV